MYLIFALFILFPPLQRAVRGHRHPALQLILAPELPATIGNDTPVLLPPSPPCSVLYVDIDIHHGDGVEEAFYTTNRVMTVR